MCFFFVGFGDEMICGWVGKRIKGSRVVVSFGIVRLV